MSRKQCENFLLIYVVRQIFLWLENFQTCLIFNFQTQAKKLNWYENFSTKEKFDPQLTQPYKLCMCSIC